MSMDVSRLGIVVESTGIKEATTALQGRNGNGGLAGAAAKAEKNVASLSATVSRLMNLQASATTAAWAAAMGQFGTVVNQVGQQLQGLTGQLNAVTNGMNQMTSASRQATRAHEDHARGSHVVMNTLKALATVSTVYAAINVAGSIIKQADAWQMMTARLQNATGSLNNAKTAQEQMFELSQRLRVPLEDQVKLYTRMAPAMQRMGKSADDAKNVVEGVATALQLGGANGAEMSSVMLQLSQSFGSGVLNGAEFNAVAENGQVIMKALMEYTGKNQAQLKKLGSEGKLSIKTVNEAIIQALPKWREQFDNLPVTFEGGVQRIKNAWTKAIGEMGQDTTFNRELSQSLRVVEDLIPTVARGLGSAFIEVIKWVKENQDKLKQIWDQVKGLIGDVWELAKAFGSVAAMILGAGENTSWVAKGIFLIRGAIAAVVDIFNVLRSAIVNVGLDILQVLLFPFQLTLKIVGDIERKIGDLLMTFAHAAKSVGMDALSESLESVAKAAQDYGDNSKNVNEAIQATINKYRLMAAGWTADLDKGHGALQTLIDDSNKASDVYDQMLARRKKVMSMDDSWGKGGKDSPPEDKAAKAELKRFEDALVQAEAMKKEQMELNKRLYEFGAAYDKLGPAQKKVIELTEQQARLEKDGADAVAKRHNAELIAIYQKAAEYERYNEHRKEEIAQDQKALSSAEEQYKAIEAAAQKAEDRLAAFGKAKGETDESVLERLKNQLASAQFEANNPYASPADVANMNAMVEVMTRMVDAQQRLTDANKGIGQAQVWEDFQKLMDPKKAEKFGDVLAQGFGKAGKALGDLTKGLQAYATRQAAINKLQKDYEKLDDGPKKLAAQKLIAEETERAWVATYADMAGAAKGFFEEGSRGYKTMQAVEMAFRTWQMAMQLKSFLQEIGLINAVTVAKVTGNETQAASSVAAANTEAAAAMVSGTADAAAGVAHQATGGDPYSAFARMAVMAAIMAALGFAVGSIGSGPQQLAADRQARQGTGTVLGDQKAQSESIAKSLEYLSENSDIALRYSSGMLHSLQNIEASLTGVTNALLRARGDITGSNYQTQDLKMSGIQGMLSGQDLPFIGGFLSKIGGFGSSRKLLDSGLTFDSQNIGDILQNGLQGKTYQDVQEEKKAFFIKYSSKTKRTTSDLSQDVEDEFSNVINSMVDTITQAGEALGMSADDIAAKLKAMNIDIGDISLKGLTGEEIQKQLEAVFSAIGDNMVKTGLGEAVTKFQQAGEGLLETAVRVASGVDQANYELEKLGLTAIDFSDIINTSGDVAAEIVRQSIMLQEQGTGVGEIIDQMNGTAAEIASVYKDLVDVRNSLQSLGIADDVTRELIRAAGGLDAMKDALSSYTDNFFSDAEKNAMQASALRKEFDKLGVTMPTTKQGFRDLVDQLSATGADGQELAMKVLLLSDAFSNLIDSSQAAIENARNDLTDAYEREAQALTDTKTKFEDFAKSLGDFKDSLLTGDLSTESPLSKYMIQKARYEDVAAKAAQGDEQALSDFQSVAEAFLNASREVYASGDQYTADFQRVLMETGALQQDTSDKATVAEQQLEALNAQVDGLITINESVLTVTEAINNLNAVLALGLGIDQVDGSHANGLAYVPHDGYVAELHEGERVLTAEENRAYNMDYSQYGTSNTSALVDEIKALRQEVASLRADQREQTGALIASNYDASERNAEAICESHKDTVRTSEYTQRAKVPLV